MSKKVTKSQVIETLEKLVAEKGEGHLYKPSRNTPHKVEIDMAYSYDDCIAGCAIRELAPDVHAAMLEFELKRHASFSLGTLEFYPSMNETLTERFTGPALEALSLAQGAQDAEKTWGVALKAAKREVR